MHNKQCSVSAAVSGFKQRSHGGPDQNDDKLNCIRVASSLYVALRSVTTAPLNQEGTEQYDFLL